ncbi:MAG: hypothetical protein LBD97_04905, partial [Bifidobacteriaceae bacterium]|nr:hypothetical protein [Bifidobacteriaceae bacterium]
MSPTGQEPSMRLPGTGLTIPTLLPPETRSVEFRARRHGAGGGPKPAVEVFPQVKSLCWFW